MELFEKFCSQDFIGLYKHEPVNEDDENLETTIETGTNLKGAERKSCSLRKSTLLKQNSEPKFNFKFEPFYTNRQEVFEEEELENSDVGEKYEYTVTNAFNRRSSYGRQLEFDQCEDNLDQFYITENVDDYRNIDEEDEIDEIYLMPEKQRYDGFLHNSEEILAIDETDEEILDDTEDLLKDSQEIYDFNAEQDFIDDLKYQDENIFDEIKTDENDDKNLKTIITEYVKNACDSAANDLLTRSDSMDLLSNSSETLQTNSNSEYAFDTVKQINLDSYSSKLSLSLNSDIFDDMTLIAPSDNAKTIKICEMDDFTLTPDGSMSENHNEARNIKVSEQEMVKNELQSQYTIIDCDELEHDGQETIQKFDGEKSSFAEALNKEFDKLFSRANNDSDTDITTTPSLATVLTAIKIPSRCSMEKLEALPFEFNDDSIIGGIKEEAEKPSTIILSQSMTSSALVKKEESSKSKSKRSHSLGAIHKKKLNKCTPL